MEEIKITTWQTANLKKKEKKRHICQNINAANCNVLTMMQYIHRLHNIHNQTIAISRQIIPVDIKVEYLCDNIICHYPTSVYIFLYLQRTKYV